MKLIKGVFVKSTKEILYSRSKHDYVSSSDGTVSIDGGRDYTKIVSNNLENSINIELNGDVLLEQILEYDWKYKNRNSDKFPDGYYGRFVITRYSNANFYDRLIISDNKHEILELMDNYSPPVEVKSKTFDIEIPEVDNLNDWYYVTCKEDVHKVLDDNYVLPSGAMIDLEYPQWITLKTDAVGFRKKDNRACIFTKDQIQNELNKIWEELDDRKI